MFVVFDISSYFCSETFNKNVYEEIKQLLCIALFFASLSVQASSKVIMNYKGGNTHTPSSRVPAAPIYVNQDDHTFIFSSNLAGEIIEVMGKDGLLYTSIIGENGKVVVPNSITGEVELRLNRGDLVYSAIVEL